ncbi:hypothetical protein [Metaplanococcus flavidus]|uniref:Uncharacterized protein n=1 Tax=Metaplanococcus flavidus TaxID=569883 RepID=A0ABW3LC25_9BACL
MSRQRAKGIKRTDFEEVEAKLLERFGGEVKRMDTDLVVAPQSLNQIVELLMGQNQKSATCSNSWNSSQKISCQIP